ncbi:hypothetical protein BHM03_00039378 [Ensete ventricosum]|nr:hypothetical protein BHM03_00039378 [Ensete ventricosum]
MQQQARTVVAFGSRGKDVTWFRKERRREASFRCAGSRSSSCVRLHGRYTCRATHMAEEDGRKLLADAKHVPLGTRGDSFSSLGLQSTGFFRSIGDADGPTELVAQPPRW